MSQNARGKRQQSEGTPDVILKACDMCRKKKIRCDPINGGCAQCTKYKTRCHFTPIAIKRKPRRLAGHKQVSQLESRLKHLESQLQQALQSQGQGSSEIQMPNNMSRDHETVIDLEKNSSSLSELNILPRHDVDSYSKLSSDGTDYSIFTTLPFPLWQGGRVQEMPLMNMPSPSLIRPTSEAGMALRPLSSPTFHPLPSKAFALELVTDAFKVFNTFFPIFDETTFLRQFHTQYLDSSPADPSWWACLNLVLAISHRFRSIRNSNTDYETRQAFGFIRNALAVVAELNFMHNNLAAVQAILGLAILIQGTASPHPASVLAATAIRLAQAMGLHRRIPFECLPKDQVEQGRRVFWLAYILDKDISLRTRQPFAQDDEDMDAELPWGDFVPSPSVDGPTLTEFYKSRIGLAMVQGQIYKGLYSVHASRQPEVHRKEVAQQLQTILGYWKSGVQIDVEDGPMAQLKTPLTTEVVHALVLRFTYVNCLIMIDLDSAEDNSLLLDDTLTAQEEYQINERACIIECRKAATLMRLIPQGDYAIVWLLLLPFFNLVKTLLVNVERYPASPQAFTDLYSVKPFLELLNVLSVEEGTSYHSEEVKRMRKSCDESFSRASEALEPVNMEGSMEELFQVI